jgi:alkanesulfonate monooxygenase SsuD/methylene tetrahydromethanopterin reductase-like flavin-dependent oxidoreductase (luciferase family)
MPFDAAGTRVARFEEALSVIKAFFTAETVNFADNSYIISNLSSLPRPMQQPHPPILIGSAGRRMLTLAARESDIIAPTLKRGPQGLAPADGSLEQKIGWIRESAGERFDRLELS